MDRTYHAIVLIGLAVFVCASIQLTPPGAKWIVALLYGLMFAPIIVLWAVS